MFEKVHRQQWQLKRSEKVNPLTFSEAVADELLGCVWSFCGVGAWSVNAYTDFGNLLEFLTILTSL